MRLRLTPQWCDRNEDGLNLYQQVLLFVSNEPDLLSQTLHLTKCHDGVENNILHIYINQYEAYCKWEICLCRPVSMA